MPKSNTVDGVFHQIRRSLNLFFWGGETGIWIFQKIGAIRIGGVFAQNLFKKRVDFFLVLLP